MCCFITNDVVLIYRNNSSILYYFLPRIDKNFIYCVYTNDYIYSKCNVCTSILYLKDMLSSFITICMIIIIIGITCIMFFIINYNDDDNHHHYQLTSQSLSLTFSLLYNHNQNHDNYISFEMLLSAACDTKTSRTY